MAVHGKPVAADADFLRREPARGALDRLALGGHAAFAQRDEIDRGVPHGRETRLDAEVARVIDEQALEVALRLGVKRVVVFVAERFQRDERVQHRGKNRAEAVAALAHALGHPGLRAGERGLASGFPRELVEELEDGVAGEEKIRPRQAPAFPAQPEETLLRADGIQLMELLVGGERAAGLVVIEDGQRDEHRPAPRGHFVDREKEPLRHEDHLDRDGGEILPRKLPEQREVELRVGIHLRDAAEPQHAGARFLHPRLRGRVARELQREVGFDRGVHLARTAFVDVPAAVRDLPPADVRDAFLLEHGIDLVRPVHEEDVVRAERAIDEKLADPVAVGVLEAEEVFLRLGNGLRERVAVGFRRTGERHRLGEGRLGLSPNSRGLGASAQATLPSARLPQARLSRR